MSQEDTTAKADLNEILNHPFVQDLLRLVSDIRKAVGDENGDLENHQVVEKVREAVKK